MRGAVIRLLIADDHPVVREGLAAILGGFPDLEVVGRAADGAEAIAAALRLRPDVLLCDLRMPGADGVEVSRRLRAEAGTAVLILSTFDDSAGILAALSAGARGYLLKDAAPQELHRAIVACRRGDTVLHPAVAGKVARVREEAPVGAAAERGLTVRELEVLAALAAGLANKQIAARLGVQESTVKTHLGHLFRKFGAADRVQVVTEGMRRGYLDAPGAARPRGGP